MAAVWNPIPRLIKLAIRKQDQVAARIRSAAPRKKHSDNKKGPIGGSLNRDVRAAALRKVGKSHVAIAWSALGQKLLWFNRGTRRQIKRTLPLDFDAAQIEGEILLDAYAHYYKLEQGVK
jgi:hypothetical protein